MGNRDVLTFLPHEDDADAEPVVWALLPASVPGLMSATAWAKPDMVVVLMDDMAAGLEAYMPSVEWLITVCEKSH